MYSSSPMKLLKGFPQFVQMVLRFEICNQSFYNKSVSGVIWPGVYSGATIGIGYDLGYVSAQQFLQDWGGKIDQQTIKLLLGFVGLKKQAAQISVKEFNQNNKIYISYSKAIEVFQSKTLLKFYNLTNQLLPGLSSKYPYTFLAMVSCVFNRGNSVEGQRRKQMWNIQQAVNGNLEINELLPIYVANQLRQMKRLWPKVPGLCKRREIQAQFALKDLQ